MRGEHSNCCPEVQESTLSCVQLKIQGNDRLVFRTFLKKKVILFLFFFQNCISEKKSILFQRDHSIIMYVGFQHFFNIQQTFKLYKCAILVFHTSSFCKQCIKFSSKHVIVIATLSYRGVMFIILSAQFSHFTENEKKIAQRQS